MQQCVIQQCLIIPHRCIRGLLADRLVVLVTHQVQFALQADKILALKDVSGQLNHHHFTLGHMTSHDVT